MSFRIGQKVVAIKNHSAGEFSKGDEFIVSGIRSCNCGLLLLKIEGLRVSRCRICSIKHFEPWYKARSFEPIINISFGEEVTEQIETEINQPVEV